MPTRLSRAARADMPPTGRSMNCPPWHGRRARVDAAPVRRALATCASRETWCTPPTRAAARRHAHSTRPRRPEHPQLDLLRRARPRHAPALLLLRVGGRGASFARLDIEASASLTACQARGRRRVPRRGADGSRRAGRSGCRLVAPEALPHDVPPRALIAVLTVWAASPLAAQVVVTGPTLVRAPLEGGSDPRAAWLGEAVAMLLADDLNALGGNALTREERVRAFERLQVSSRATLTSATTIKIGQLVGASTVVERADDVPAATRSRARRRSRAHRHGPGQRDIPGARCTRRCAGHDRTSGARRLSPGATVPTADRRAATPAARGALSISSSGLLSETPATRTLLPRKGHRSRRQTSTARAGARRRSRRRR